ncbi:hypothetical protein Tco_1013727, partial [Tanacetum coccineum]
MHLPPLILKDGDSSSIKECCLSLPPDDPKSILLLTRRDKPTFVFCLLECRRNRLKWSEIPYAKQLGRISSDGFLVHSLCCCNGKVYALNTDNTFYSFVIEIGIVVKDGGVGIKLMLFTGCPDLPYDRGLEFMYFLRGSNTELFCIRIGLNYKASKTGRRHEELDEEEQNNMFTSSEMWEQMKDLKDGNFCVDLARDNSVAYSPTIASEFGGNIHIRSKKGKVIYSYNLSDRTILKSSMFPSPVLPTRHVSVWECRLAADYAKAEQEVEGQGPWDCAAPVVRWRGEVALKRLQNYSLLSPWLMMADEKRGIVTLEDPFYGYKYFMKKLPASVADGETCHSGYGWLLYYSEGGLEFCNPFSNE